jgi:hypothetical protein
MTKTTASRGPSDLRAAFAALAIVATAATPVVAFAGATELPTTTVSVEPTYSPQRGYSCWTADSAVWAARCSRSVRKRTGFTACRRTDTLGEFLLTRHSGGSPLVSQRF